MACVKIYVSAFTDGLHGPSGRLNKISWREKVYEKRHETTLLAFMVMAMLASSAAVPAMALAVPDGEGVVGQVLGATHSNGDEGVSRRLIMLRKLAANNMKLSMRLLQRQKKHNSLLRLSC